MNYNLTAAAPDDDYFVDLFVFRAETVVLCTLCTAVMMTMIPLSVLIIHYEDTINRSQTLLTRLNTHLLRLILVFVPPNFFMDTARYITGRVFLLDF